MKFMIVVENFEKKVARKFIRRDFRRFTKPDTSNIYSPARLSSVFARKLKIFFFLRWKLSLEQIFCADAR